MERRMKVEFVREIEGEKKGFSTSTNMIRGHAAVFNQLSDDLGGFREKIEPGAFKRALANGNDILCLVDHDKSRMLGRTSTGTCRVKEDDKGLYFECDLPNTSAGNDVRELIKRGDMSQCSFGFHIDEDDWDEMDDPENPDERMICRTIRSVRDVTDVSPVTQPAYPQTSVKAL